MERGKHGERGASWLARGLAALAVVWLLAALTAAPASSQTGRIKDLANVEGADAEPLLGYGLIVGLGGTGDGQTAAFTVNSLAAMLERLGAFDAQESFEALMQVCACDYRAHGEGFGPVYPKAELLYTALRACREVASDADDLDLARAQAIAAALGSQRWSAAGNV